VRNPKSEGADGGMNPGVRCSSLAARINKIFYPCDCILFGQFNDLPFSLHVHGPRPTLVLTLLALPLISARVLHRKGEAHGDLSSFIWLSTIFSLQWHSNTLIRLTTAFYAFRITGGRGMGGRGRGGGRGMGRGMRR
jgi:hypothetical protein